MFRKVFFTLALSLAAVSGVYAQTSAELVRKAREDQYYTASGDIARWCISTNLVDWAFYGTINGEAQFSIARHFTVAANAKYNNWTFKDDIVTERHRAAQQTYAVGFRYWPWYVYSGWWIGLKGQYQEYSRGGIFKVLEKEEGDAYGAALSGGYSVQVTKWLDVDFGLGFWGGTKNYVTWQLDGESCPACGRRVDSGTKFFLLPNEVYVAVAIIF